MKHEDIGSKAFIAGAVIAVIAGFVNLNPDLVASALVILGLVVGRINVTEKETTAFLLATVSLVIVSTLANTGLSSVPSIGAQLQDILTNIMTLVMPAVVVVTLRQIYGIAKSA